MIGERLLGVGHDCLNAMSISENYENVRARIARACARVGRESSEVTLVAVTKYAPIDAVNELVALGQRDLGESRPQQLAERAELFKDDALTWHLIGHLQRNKARKILPLVSLIHSVDSVRLLEALDRLAGELDLRPRVLLEVNISGEESKGGFESSELRAEWSKVEQLSQLDVAGLMTMAPYADDPEEARPVFRALRELRDELVGRGRFALPELSMGMSGDFEVGIEEGATIVRVGSVLFGE